MRVAKGAVTDRRIVTIGREEAESAIGAPVGEQIGERKAEPSKGPDGARREAAAAGLVAREALAVHDQDTQPDPRQAIGQGGASRARPNDQHIRLHTTLRSVIRLPKHEQPARGGKQTQE